MTLIEKIIPSYESKKRRINKERTMVHISVTIIIPPTIS